MKIKPEFIVRKIGSKYYAVSGARAAKGEGMIALNETGAEIFKLMQTDTDAAAVAKALTEIYDVDLARATQDVEAFILRLKEVDALA